MKRFAALTLLLALPALAGELKEVVAQEKKSVPAKSLTPLLEKELAGKAPPKSKLDGALTWTELPPPLDGSKAFDVKLKIELKLVNELGAPLGYIEEELQKEDLGGNAPFQLMKPRKASYAKMRDAFSALVAPRIAAALLSFAERGPQQRQGLLKIEANETYLGGEIPAEANELVPEIEKLLLASGLKGKRVTLSVTWMKGDKSRAPRATVSANVLAPVTREILASATQDFHASQELIATPQGRQKEARVIAPQLVDALVKQMAPPAQ